MYGDGISLEGDVLDLGVKFELIEKSGAWYSHKGERIGQGRDQSVKFLKENPKMTQDLREEILARTIYKAKTEAKLAEAASQAKNAPAPAAAATAKDAKKKH